MLDRTGAVLVRWPGGRELTGKRLAGLPLPPPGAIEDGVAEGPGEAGEASLFGCASVPVQGAPSGLSVVVSLPRRVALAPAHEALSGGPRGDGDGAAPRALRRLGLRQRAGPS